MTDYIHNSARFTFVRKNLSNEYRMKREDSFFVFYNRNCKGEMMLKLEPMNDTESMNNLWYRDPVLTPEAVARLGIKISSSC